MPLVREVKKLVYGVLHMTPLGRLVLGARSRKQRKAFEAGYEANRKLREERVPGQLQAIRERVAAGKPVRVAFLVAIPQIFSLRSVFEDMCADLAFEPRIVVTTEQASPEDMQTTLVRTYASLHAEYGDKVMPVDDGAYDVGTGHYPDISKDFDICIFSRPYDDLVPLEFKMEHLAETCLCIYSGYGYGGVAFMDVSVHRTPCRGVLWRMFAHNEQERKIVGDTNAVITGSCVNDRFATHVRHETGRKRIILAPHHTIPGWAGVTLQISTFLTHYKLFSELPDMYPQVDFIFRPHPLLFQKLKDPSYWGKERTEAWLKDFLSHPNVIHDTSGDYTAVMTDSDAIIHDCNSFMADYFYTDKPHCYLMRKHVDYRCFLTEFGMDVLSHTYKAYNRKQICEFIENVVLKGEDPMKEERLAFADAEIKIGYPGVHQKIMAHLREEFGIPAPSVP